MTLNFSGFPAVAGGGLSTVADPNCLGFGARIAVRNVGPGDPDLDVPLPRGPISSPVIVNPGRCYASRDWVMPTLAAFGNGRGAVFDVVMEPHPTGSCGRPRWRIASISVTGGTGYTNNSLLTIVPAAGDATATAAVARVQSVGGVPQSVTIQNRGIYYRPTTGDRDVPVVTATVGGGAKLGVALERIDGEPAEWKVSYVSVLLPGSGLSTGAAITFAVGDRTTQTQAAVATLVADSDGKAVAVSLNAGGKYYRDTNIPPVVIQPTFTFGGTPNAVVRGVVDDTPNSETFGQVLSLVIENAGDVLGYRNFDIGNATLNGQSRVARAETSESLITLCVSSCHGNGAALRAIGHVEPFVQASFVGLFPPLVTASLLVSIEEIPGSAPKLWQVSKLEFTGGNFPGAIPGQQIFISPGTDTVMVTPATAQFNNDLEPVITDAGAFFRRDTFWDGVPGPLTGVQLLNPGQNYALRGRVAPSLTATAGGSSTMAVSLAQQNDACNVPFWEVDDITASGSGVTDRRVVTIVRDPLDTQAVQALAVVSTREEPTVTATPPAEPLTEQAAAFAVTLTKTEMVIPPRATLTPGQVSPDVSPAYWSVTAIDITSPGLGYPTTTRLTIEVDSGTETKPAAALAFANPKGEIVSVLVETGGEYFLDNLVPQDVTIVRPGVYYREDSSLAPYVATPTAVMTQIAPSNGTGAVINLTVDTDTASDSFGAIIAATIPQGQGGTGYHMRSGARPNSFPGEVRWTVDNIILTATPQGLSAATNNSISSDTGNPAKTDIFFSMANKRAGVNCPDWFTNALTPVTRTTAGSITAVPGGAYTP